MPPLGKVPIYAPPSQILHFQNHAGYDMVKLETLAAIAVQCDKYDCKRALRPWISVWLSSLNHRES
jgi:hypothetical protein